MKKWKCKNCGNFTDLWKDGSCAPCRRVRKKIQYAKDSGDIAVLAARTKMQKEYALNAKKFELDPQDHSLSQKRRDKIKLATPLWLSIEQKADIQAMYFKARWLSNKTGIPHVVDHIIPIKHPDASGLHVPWNLQVITHEDNSTKQAGTYTDVNSL